MKKLKHDPISKADSETSNKHDVNLQKNSTLYFQIGLILCLLCAYISLEYNFEQYIPEIETVKIEDDDNILYVPTNYRIEKEVAMNKPKVKTKVLVEPKIVDNDTSDEVETKNIVDELVKTVSEGTSVKQIDPDDLIVDEPEEPLTLPMNVVENVPVYPGCENAGNNAAKVKCMSNKLSKLVKKRFDTDIAAEEGLNGIQRIFVLFKIDKNGDVKLMKTRAPHAALEKEASRLTSKIPAMKPGVQNGKTVEVLYTLPIVFDVQN